MEFLKNEYKVPQTRVIEVNVLKVLCASILEGKNTEKITVSGNSYGDDNFE